MPRVMLGRCGAQRCSGACSPLHRQTWAQPGPQRGSEREPEEGWSPAQVAAVTQRWRPDKAPAGELGGSLFCLRLKGWLQGCSGGCRVSPAPQVWGCGHLRLRPSLSTAPGERQCPQSCAHLLGTPTSDAASLQVLRPAFGLRMGQLRGAWLGSQEGLGLCNHRAV